MRSTQKAKALLKAAHGGVRRLHFADQGVELGRGLVDQGLGQSVDLCHLVLLVKNDVSARQETAIREESIEQHVQIAAAAQHIETLLCNADYQCGGGFLLEREKLAS